MVEIHALGRKVARAIEARFTLLQLQNPLGKNLPLLRAPVLYLLRVSLRPRPGDSYALFGVILTPFGGFGDGARLAIIEELAGSGPRFVTVAVFVGQFDFAS